MNGYGCQACPAGKYQGNTGSAQCTSCPGGKYVLSPAQTSEASCQECNVNTYSAEGSDSCVVCPSGKLSARGSSSLNDCKSSCPAGMQGEPGSCTPCAPNTYNDEENGQCRPCPSLSQSSEGSSGCSCNAGYELRDGVCKASPAGSHKSSAGNGPCEKCDAGTYSGAEGAISSSDCTTCPEHSSSPAGSTDISQCACNGSYEKQESSDSFTCVEDKSIACELQCPDHHYTKLCKCTQCKSCRPGSQPLGCGGDHEGTCALCPADTFKEQDGPSSCTPCEEGFESRPGSSYCCPIGTTDSSGTCMKNACPKGTYGRGGMCVECEAGTYRQDEFSNVCAACHANMQSPAGSKAAADCTCKSGYVSTGANRCAKAIQNVPVVEVAVSLPMTKAAFESQEKSFVSALARGAGVAESDVTILSVTEISSRRVHADLPGEEHGRKLLATSIEVKSEIETSNPQAVSSALTPDALNTALAAAGLPEATGMTTAVRQPPPAAKSSAPTSQAPAEEKEESSSQVGLIAGASAGGAVGVLAAVVMPFCDAPVTRSIPCLLVDMCMVHESVEDDGEGAKGSRERGSNTAGPGDRLSCQRMSPVSSFDTKSHPHPAALVVDQVLLYWLKGRGNAVKGKTSSDIEAQGEYVRARA